MRVITRLDETCREVRDAARVIGDAELMNKMEEAQTRIKRDSESSVSFLSDLLACITRDAGLWRLFLFVIVIVLTILVYAMYTVVFAASLYF